jgi:hypothetical protein
VKVGLPEDHIAASFGVDLKGKGNVFPVLN